MAEELRKLERQHAHDNRRHSSPYARKLQVALCASQHRLNPTLQARIDGSTARLRPKDTRTGPPGSYQYRPLESNRTVRLLILRARDAYDVPDLICSVIHVSLDAAPDFEAVSYVWGDPKFSSQMYCIPRLEQPKAEVTHFDQTDTTWQSPGLLALDLATPAPQALRVTPDPKPLRGSDAGKALPQPRRAVLAITKSLNDLLQALRLESDDRLLWADAVCINQNDLAERSQQVTLMRDIYSGAREVIAWVGQPQPSDNKLFGAMRHLAKEQTSQIDHVGEATSSGISSGSWSVDGYMKEIVSAMKDSAPHRSVVWVPLMAFLGRSWFSRVWIIQECALARKISFRCGHWDMRWEAFEELVGILENIHQLGLAAGSVRSSLARSQWLISLRRMTAINRSAPEETESPGLETVSGCTFEAPKSKTSDWHGDLHFAVVGARSFQATNPRDHLYGILGLVRKDEAAMITPAYAHTHARVYVDFVKQMISTSGSADLLCEASDNPRPTTKNLPSWVPDFSIPRRTAPIYHRRLHRYEASGQTKAHVLRSNADHMLRMRGLFVDSVVAVSAPFVLDETSSKPKSRALKHVKRFVSLFGGRELLNRDPRLARWRKFAKNSLFTESEYTMVSANLEPGLASRYFVHNVNEHLIDVISRWVSEYDDSGSLTSNTPSFADVMRLIPDSFRAFKDGLFYNIVRTEHLFFGPGTSTQWCDVRTLAAQEAEWRTVANKGGMFMAAWRNDSSYWRVLCGNRRLEPQSGDFNIPDAEWREGYRIWRDLVASNQNVLRRLGEGRRPRIRQRFMFAYSKRLAEGAAAQYVKDVRQRDGSYKNELQLPLHDIMDANERSRARDIEERAQELGMAAASDSGSTLDVAHGIDFHARGIDIQIDNHEDGFAFNASLGFGQMEPSPTPEDVLYRDVGRVFERDLIRIGHGRRFCRTKRGLLGWVPADTRVGDQIAIIHGASVPMVLAKPPNGYAFTSNKSCWCLKGEAYIHGMMKGEALAYGVEQEPITLI